MRSRCSAILKATTTRPLAFQPSKSNTTGVDNTAIGSSALKDNTTGEANTANGVGALESNTEGDLNRAIGEVALTFNTTGSQNTANGVAALLNNIDGNSNTASGLSALHDNASGSSNTAEGDHALFSNIGGNGNTASGDSALGSNTEGNFNTGTGENALSGNTTGSINTALGLNAGSNLTTGDNNIDIGANVNGVAGESNTIRIGNTDITGAFIRGISGQTIPSGAAVLVAANGQLGTATSSKRFKEGIKPMDKASEALFLLEPVTFRYKREIDPAGRQQFGLVAEDVEKLNPDLVARDENGRVNTVRYEQVNAMLLNEFIKEHREVEAQQATITQLKSDAAKQDATISELKEGMRVLTARLKDQAAQMQKVSARIDLNNALPRTVLNHRR